MSVQSELRLYLRVIWRYRLFILLSTAAAAFVATGITLLMTPVYTATTTLRIASAPSGILDFGSIAFATHLSNTYVEVVTSEPIMQELAAEFGTGNVPSIEAEAIPDTELIAITSTHANPETAAQGARLLSSALVERGFDLYSGTQSTSSAILEEQITRARDRLDAAVADYEALLDDSDVVDEGEAARYLDTIARQSDIYSELVQRLDLAQLNEAIRAGAVSVVEPAAVPAAPTSPNQPLNVALGVVGGMGMGLVLAFILDSLDTRLRTTDDVLRISSEVPVMTQIPEVVRPLRFWHSPETFVTGFTDQRHYDEAYRRLWISLSLMRSDLLPKSLLITSPDPGTGKSTVVANLGKVLTQSNRQTLLIDLDVRRPQLHKLFDTANIAGLGDVLTDEVTLEDAIQHTELTNVDLLTAGQSYEQINLVNYADELMAMLRILGERYDHIILDSPALLFLADAMVAARLSSAVLLVIALNHTSAPEVRDSIRYLEELQVDIAGIVINRVNGIPRSEMYRHVSPRKRLLTSGADHPRLNGRIEETRQGDAVVEN